MQRAAWSLEASRREDELQQAAAHQSLQQVAPGSITAGLGITTHEYSPGLGIGESLQSEVPKRVAPLAAPSRIKPNPTSPTQVLLTVLVEAISPNGQTLRRCVLTIGCNDW